MFPSPNPTAHLRSNIEMEVLSKAVLWGTHELWLWVSDGTTTCTILTQGLRNCHQTDNHEMSSYAAWFVLEEKNLAFLKSAQPISPKLSASLFLYAIESWESPSALPDNQTTEESDTSSPSNPSHFLWLFCILLLHVMNMIFSLTVDLSSPTLLTGWGMFHNQCVY